MRRASVVALVAVSIALGILTQGTPQFIAVMVAIGFFIAWIVLTRPYPRRDRRLKLPKSAWIWLPLVVTVTGLVTLPFLGYASLGVVNAVFLVALDWFSRR